MKLEELAATYVLQQIDSNDLKEHALELILAGHESPSLAALAGAARNESPHDLRELFERALSEMNVVLPDRLSAGNFFKKLIAARPAVDHCESRSVAHVLWRDAAFLWNDALEHHDLI